MSFKLYACCLALICALVPARAAAQPLLELQNGTMDFGVTLGADSRLRGTATLSGPTLRITTGGKRNPARANSGFPMQVERLVIHDGVIIFSSGAEGRELIRVHGLELTVENFSNRRGAGAQTVITGRGKIGKVGQLDLAVKADPGTANFTGRAQIEGLGLTELGALVDKRFAVPLLKGSFALGVDFAVRDGQITGTARPTLAGLGIGPGTQSPILGGIKSPLPQDVMDRLPGGLGGALGGFGGKGKEGGKAAASPFTAVIPLRGALEHPEAALWTALVDVLQTSFAQSSAVSFLQTPGLVR